MLLNRRDEAPTYLRLEVECPIDVTGTYTAAGQLLFVPIEGHGPFRVKTSKYYNCVPRFKRYTSNATTLASLDLKKNSLY